MPRVFGWMADTSGCGYYRLAMPFEQLRREGFEAQNSVIMPADVQHGGADVVVGQRVCEPGPSRLWEQLAVTPKTTLVFELDDDLFRVEKSNKMAHRFYTPERQDQIRRNIEIADAVTVSTDTLAEIVSEWNPNVHVIPNHIRSWMFEWDRPRNDTFTIGWGGSPTHSRDFGEMAKPLKALLQHPRWRGNTEFHCVGPDFTDRVASIHGQTRHSGWSDRVEDYLQSIDFDLGVIPLRDSEFNRAKSDIKFKELAALGVPVIASNVGPYADAIDHCETGILVDSPKEWAEALDFMRSNPLAAETMGKRARRAMYEHSVENNTWRWKEAYGL